jgi:3-hydroxyacyl-[acyl-carrier protein] dehydratase/trans-2-decenoyl-[acyl-carrier protein] isomerase
MSWSMAAFAIAAISMIGLPPTAGFFSKWCLGIDALWQALGLFLVWNGHEGKCRALGVKDVQFYGEILPTVKTVRFHVHVKRVVKRGMTLVIGDGYVFADGKEIYSAKHLKAALI